jgi:hypothetical protein
MGGGHNQLHPHLLPLHLLYSHPSHPIGLLDSIQLLNSGLAAVSTTATAAASNPNLAISSPAAPRARASVSGLTNLPECEPKLAPDTEKLSARHLEDLQSVPERWRAGTANPTRSTIQTSKTMPDPPTAHDESTTEYAK